ncbi:MAG: carboxypeptidase-like regulatory domain-containing protein [Ferruginibacter sp.]
MSTEDYSHSRVWDASDFERYYKDLMPSSERNALEKAALEDHFLQDALDGYAFTDDAVAAINDIREQIIDFQKPALKLVWFQQKNVQRLIRVAAVLLITGALTFVLFNNNKVNTPSIASITTDTTVPTTVVDKPDDATLTVLETDVQGKKGFTDVPLFIQQQPKPPAVVKSLNNTTPSTSFINDVKIDSNINDLIAVNRSKVEEITTASDKSTKESVAAAPSLQRFPITVIRGQVINQQGIPIANATIKDQETNVVIATDFNGNFELSNSKNYSNVTIDVNAAGYRVLQSNLSNNASNRIVLQEEKSTDNNAEVEAVPLPQKKYLIAPIADSSIKEDLPGYFNMNRVTLQYVTPVAGWDVFNSFIEANLKSATSLGSSSKGKVVVGFSINAAGNAENIQIKSSLDSACDAEAIRLIEKSPAFKRTKRLGKIEAIIKF